MTRHSVVCLAVVGLLGITTAVSADSGPWLGSLEQALARAGSDDQLILVDLYADWCGWCKRMENEVFSTRTFQDYARDFVLLRVDTEDGGEGSRLQERFGVFSLPTTLVLNHRRVKVGEIMGFAPVDRYIGRIEQEIAVWRELESSFLRLDRSADARLLALLAEEFHQRRDGERAGELYRRLLSSGELAPSRQSWTRYQLTDALRLAGRLDDALEELARARNDANRVSDDSLAERLDLLAAEIAIDRGDCQRARAALEDFLGRHPASSLRRYARRTLANLRAESLQCT